MDKMLTHMVGLEKQDLIELLKAHDDPKEDSLRQSMSKLSHNSSTKDFLIQPSSVNDDSQQ